MSPGKTYVKKGHNSVKLLSTISEFKLRAALPRGAMGLSAVRDCGIS